MKNAKFISMPQNNINIIRSNRKSLALEIIKSGEVIVRAPHNVTMLHINKFVAEKQDWIKKGLIKLQELQQLQPEEYKFQQGETFPYRGTQYGLILEEKSKYAFRFDDKNFYLDKACIEDAPYYFEKFYRGRASIIIPPRVMKIAEFYKLQVKQAKISSAKRRWGSCSGKGNINIAWRLIMAPPKVLDAVIVHELVHRIHMNHSKDFYSLVAKAIPEYKTYDKWLIENGNEIQWV